MCDSFPRKFDVQTSYKPSNYILGLIFVVNINFPRATYHTIVPSTEELYCSNRTRPEDEWGLGMGTTRWERVVAPSASCSFALSPLKTPVYRTRCEGGTSKVS